MFAACNSTKIKYSFFVAERSGIKFHRIDGMAVILSDTKQRNLLIPFPCYMGTGCAAIRLERNGISKYNLITMSEIQTVRQGEHCMSQVYTRLVLVCNYYFKSIVVMLE